MIGQSKPSNENPSKQDIITSLSMAKAKFQATIQKNDAHINVLLGKNNDLNTLIRVSRSRCFRPLMQITV